MENNMATKKNAGSKINLDFVLRNLEGEEMLVPDSSGKPTKTPMAARHAIRTALVHDDPKNQSNGEEKLKRFELAIHKLNATDPDFTPEERVTMKKACDFYWSILAYGQLAKIIDGKTDPFTND